MTSVLIGPIIVITVCMFTLNRGFGEFCCLYVDFFMHFAADRLFPNHILCVCVVATIEQIFNCEMLKLNWFSVLCAQQQSVFNVSRVNLTAVLLHCLK